MSKPKIGFYWCASCGGCEEAVVDLNENILAVVEAVDIVFWPVAMDFKHSDVAAMDDNEMAVCFINGAVRNSDQVEMAELLRRKAQVIVAFGSCSHLGGIPGLANQFNHMDLLERVYQDNLTVDNPDDIRPQSKTAVNGDTLTLPRFHEQVSTLGQIIDVDYYLPGCPPPVALIEQAVTAILEGKLPDKGAVLAPDIALCDECDRKESKPIDLSINRFKRPSQAEIKQEECILAQGFPCLGAATRSGCGAVCVVGNMPCTGCMGPTSRITDYGAKALSALASGVSGEDPDDIRQRLEQIVDPVGTFYRYSLPAGLLGRNIAAEKELVS